MKTKIATGATTLASGARALVATAMAIAVLGAVLGAVGCASTGFSRVTPDFDKVHRTSLFRLHVVVAPAPAGDARVGAMAAKVAQRYVNQHRDYIAKASTAAAQVDGSACSDGIEGVLHLQLHAARNQTGAAVAAQGRLLRCSDGAIVWEGAANGSWDADDANLVQVRSQYAREFGASVEPYVAPIFYALRELLDTLPKPKLERDVDIDEKIEVGQ